MRSSRLLHAAVAASIAMSAAAGCAAAPVRVDRLSVVYASAPAPRRVGDPLYVYVDTATFASDRVTDDPSAEPIEIQSLMTFVRRDVRRVLADHFSNVLFVDSPPTTDDAHYLAEVAVARIDTSDNVAGGVSMRGHWGGQSLSGNRVVAAIDWSLVISRGNGGEVVYSFADRAVGTFATRDPEQAPRMVASAIEAALRNLAADLRQGKLAALPSQRAAAVATRAAKQDPAPRRGKPRAAASTGRVDTTTASDGSGSDDSDDDGGDDAWANRPGYTPPP